MSLQDLTTVLNHLPKLDIEELMKVKSKLGASLSLSGGKPEPSVTEIDDYLFNGIMVELRRRGLLGRNSILTSGILSVKYRQSSAQIRALFKEQLGELKPVEYAALGQLAAKALADYLEQANVTIGPSVLVNNIEKVPQALDASYPGYLEAGLLSFCWK